MKSENRTDLVKYRMQRAEQSLSEAAVLLENPLPHAAINRLYYACFYSVLAVLVKNKIETKTHSGVRHQFHLHFVKNGSFDKELGKFYSAIFDKRLAGDYNDFYEIEIEYVQSLQTPASQFVEKIKALL